MMGLKSSGDLPGYLVEALPESEEAVDGVRLQYEEWPATRTYGYVSLGFWWPVFEPALTDGTDLGLVRRCFEVLEAMLSCPDSDVRDAAGIRVTPYLMEPGWGALVDRYAGPATFADLRRLGYEHVVPRLSTYVTYLQERFPEWREGIDDVVESEVVDWQLANALTRDILVGEVLKSAVESGDDERLGRWYRAVEELLASPDSELTDAVLHEVPRAAWDAAAHAVVSQSWAGPLLAKAIDEHYGNATWRTKTGWVDEPRKDPRVMASVWIYQYRGELLMHGRRYSVAEDNWPTTRPFVRTSAAGEPVEIGAVVSGVLQQLVGDISEVQHQAEEFLEFAGGVEWRMLYTESLIVVVEFTSAEGDVGVWAHAGEQRGDIFVSQPIAPPTTSNMHWVDDLGSSVLAALYRSSTTGWVGPYPSDDDG